MEGLALEVPAFKSSSKEYSLEAASVSAFFIWEKSFFVKATNGIMMIAKMA